MSNETERVRCIYNKPADRCDRMIRIPEKLLLATPRVDLLPGSRRRAPGHYRHGQELPYYPKDMQLTGVKLSPDRPDGASPKGKATCGTCGIIKMVVDAERIRC